MAVPWLESKNSCGISMGLCFWPGYFQVVSHNFAELSVGESLLVQSDKSKNSGFFFSKTVYPQPMFSGIAHSSQDIT